MSWTTRSSQDRGTSGRATGKVRLAFARCDRKGAADSRPVRQFVQHPRMDGGLLTDSESIGEVKKALAGFPGLADVAVVGHGAGQPDACLIAYVVPSGPGLDLPEVHAHARKALSSGCMPAVIMVIDEIPVCTVIQDGDEGVIHGEHVRV
jgi:hypothetical protein